MDKWGNRKVNQSVPGSSCDGFEGISLLKTKKRGLFYAFRAFTAFSILLIFFSRVSPAPCGQPTPDQEQAYLQKITQESSNPVGELWLITNQFNLNLQQAPKNRNFQADKPEFNYNFQPVLKFDLGSDWRLVTRPLVPLYDSPVAKGESSVDYAFGLGDINFKALLSPNTKGPGFRWGVGPSAILPTATDTRLGNGKWQLGGALAALYLDDKWVVGMFPEHWWSVAGDPTRQAVSLTRIDYFIWYSPAPTWQVGMSPTATIDWLQKNTDDAVTLPVGLGVSKTVLFGKLPVKFGVEADYAVIRPRRVAGDEWTFKFSIIPVIPELF